MARRRVVRRVGSESGGTLILDSHGVTSLADGKPGARAQLEWAIARGARILVSAITLTETLRGHHRDARIHRVLSRITTVAVTPELGRAAGELLGKTGLSGHRCAIDAVIAATALASTRPGVIMTSDPSDFKQLANEPEQPKHERIVVVPV